MKLLRWIQNDMFGHFRDLLHAYMEMIPKYRAPLWLSNGKSIFCNVSAITVTSKVKA